ncbi:MAG TPA: NEW3 domain-containing protein [Verrucomicrobiae bacterium]|nr:NEW3 domain-containing protein [Verrucomicrobiae bacterium]
MPTSLIARARRPAIALAAAAVLLVGLVPAVGAADSLAVTTPYPSIAVAPGSNASFDLTVTAPSSGTVDLSVSGAPTGWKATLHGGGFVVSGVTAAPGKPGTARLDVDVPADTTATKATITVEAKLGSQRASLVIQVGVDATVAGDITLTTSSPTLTGSSDSPFTFDLTLQNGSAEDQTVSASATGPAGWTIQTKLAQANAASTVVKAGSSTTITVTATPPDAAPAGHSDLTVTATAGTKTITGKLGIDITGTYTMTMSTPGDLLSAHGSAGSPSNLTLEIKNTGTAAITGVTPTGTPPTGWTVTFDPKTLDSVAPGETKNFTATITPSAEAVAGDYVVSFSASSAATDTIAAAKSNADIRYTVETSPLWALVGIGVIVAIVIALFYVFRTYGRR